MKRDLIALMRMLQFSDSAFPIGSFSFSNGIESATYSGLVNDKETLGSYVRSLCRQMVYTDFIASLVALRAYKSRAYDVVLLSDEQVILCKMNAESRQMSQRMGKKMGELASHLLSDLFLSCWLTDIDSGLCPGTYPVAQALVFGACDMEDYELFSSQYYGVINLALSAALRCIRVSHYDTQQILFELSGEMERDFLQVRQLGLEDMCAFAPETDILASLHEHGMQRMFMN